MMNTKQLIEENNEKRKLLTEDNLKVYEDFLLYIRTDLRIAEHEGEELLLELLDHLLVGQEEGKTAENFFGKEPVSYAEELIAGLPREKKRKMIPFTLSQIFNSLGWFGFVLGFIYLILPSFAEVRADVTLGNLLVIALAVMFFTGFGVNIIFKLVRSTLFKEKKAKRQAYWKAGFWGAGSFAIIMLFSWLSPDFGPVVSFEWWIYLAFGGVSLLVSKVLKRLSN
ncbi:DUF1129 family protein [Sutcliffiella deserti]|uniref:DUF1129 family protein n=1 Tax=Sutcliffiella deserti TaxID=2875501 RepID=UPI001CBB06A0|nr:DUF1129 family protein [Sutcliffiella deserti]